MDGCKCSLKVFAAQGELDVYSTTFAERGIFLLGEAGSPQNSPLAEQSVNAGNASSLPFKLLLKK